jgi:lactate racemase
MQVVVPYKKETLTVEVPDDRLAGVLEPNEVESANDPVGEVKKSFSIPYGTQCFTEFLSAPGELLVIVNDGTRPTPTRFVLEAIADELEAAQATFMIATGVHRGPTAEEYEFIFGSQYDRFAERILVHDARKDEMVYLGVSKNGTEMYLNKQGVGFEKILIIGSVEPHYFAGYTGGRKGLLPGIASYQTIEQNHKHALSSKACALALEGNPVHEDMIDALKVVKNNLFTIMTVLDKHQKIYAVTAGDIHKAFYGAIHKANEVFVAPILEKVDVVVSCAKYPMDVDLYQAQKAIENAKLALKPGGILILVAACRDGIGEKAFSDLLSSCDTSEAVLEKIAGEYKLGYHKAGKIAEVNQWAQIWAYTELEDAELEQIFLHPVADLQEAVDNALREKGEGSKVLFLPDGSVTVPQIR